jgi:adenylate kinase family enzyme
LCDARLVRKVLVLGRGGAGKSAFARRLAVDTGLPLVELDRHFWQSDLSHPAASEFSAIQEELATGSAWILDGDLGPYDVLAPRLRAADTIVVLDFPLRRCVWQSLLRGRERRDYWMWVVTYRRRYLPSVLRQIQAEAPTAHVHLARRPKDLDFRSW